MTADPKPAIGQIEFIILIAMMISLTALSIDAMIPALPQIGRDLGVASENDAQTIIASLFVGFAIGQLVYGPLSDAWGRRPLIYAGLVIYIIGTVICLMAQSMPVMLAGRVIQGIGAAGPRIVCTALVRDLYEGRAMARIMSFIMSVFILVPAIAPALGQTIMLFADWRAIFVAFLVLAILSSTWFGFRQPETLPPDRRRPLSLPILWQGTVEICLNREAVGYTIASGFVFAALIVYLSTAQQVLAVQYGLGDMFPAWFAVLALSVGSASVINGRLVMQLGMRRLSLVSMALMAGLSIVVGAVTLATGGHPPFFIFYAYCLIAFFCMGIQFGNLNALAMEPLGDKAGLGAALIGCVSTVIGVAIGGPIAHAYDGTVTPVMLGFAATSVATLILLVWLNGKDNQPA